MGNWKWSTSIRQYGSSLNFQTTTKWQCLKTSVYRYRLRNKCERCCKSFQFPKKQGKQLRRHPHLHESLDDSLHDKRWERRPMGVRLHTLWNVCWKISSYWIRFLRKVWGTACLEITYITRCKRYMNIECWLNYSWSV